MAPLILKMQSANNGKLMMNLSEYTDWPYESRPNFFVIGVVKGGTTSLYHYLDQHPEVYLPSVKETNHFARFDIDEKHFFPNYALDIKLDLDNYIASGMKEKVHIAHVNNPEHYKALYNNVGLQKSIGEISNSYMVCQSVAKAIYDFNPQSKILVILRDPVSRAWSQYLMNLRESKTTENDFLSELKADYQRIYKGWGVSHQYLELGNYSQQLSRYFELFGRSQVHVVFYEQYRENPQLVLADICRFLEVHAEFKFNFSEESNKASIPRSKYLNKLLVGSGMIKVMKKMVPKKYRSGLAGVLYTEKGLPDIQQHEIDFLVDYYRAEVADLNNLLHVNTGLYWKHFV